MSYSVYLPNYSIGENCYKELPYVARSHGKNKRCTLGSHQGLRS